MSAVEDFQMATDERPDEDIVMEGSNIDKDATGANGEVGQEDEGEGQRLSDDSSIEDEDDDEDAERKVREGFIVDEGEDDEDDEEVDEEEERRRRKKRRKHKHRHRKRRENEEDLDEDLDEDDLELLEENTGGRVQRSRHLTRLRRGRDSGSPEASSSKRKARIESSDDDLDEGNIIGARDIQDIQNIWDDDRAGGRDDDDEGDIDDFIDDDEEVEEGAGAMAEEEREERRRERRRLEKERRKVLKSRPELTGIDANAFDEIHDVFGDGHDYDWALMDDDEDGATDEAYKSDLKMGAVFEPSVIKARLLTDDDELIRAQDIPERMQLATSTLSRGFTLSFAEPLTVEECVDGASWVTPRLGKLKERDFFRPDGPSHHLLGGLVQAVTRVLEYLFVQMLEVPYIYSHRRDYLYSFDPKNIRSRHELLSLDDLWRIYNMGQKYRSMLQRKKALQSLFDGLNVEDEYYRDHLKESFDKNEVIADTTQWLGMKYREKRKEISLVDFNDDEGIADKKHKLPSKNTAYDVAKKTVVSGLANAFGIQAHQIALNFLSGGQNTHFVDDPDTPPMSFAEQFADPDPQKSLSSDELLRQARMILATELGADPLLRQHVREQFKLHAQVSCSPTDRGRIRIDKHHTYYKFKYLYNKPVTEMLESSQALSIFAAESEHLVTVSIFLPIDVKQDLQHRLSDAFSSDSFSDTAKAWNDERVLVIQEAIEKHLIPAGVKYTREWLREEVEDYLCGRCSEVFHERLNAAPYHPPELDDNESPSVLAVTWGKGDPRKDEITFVYLDDEGRVREYFHLDNLSDSENVEQFKDILNRRRPDVVGIGGLSHSTTKLIATIKRIMYPSQYLEHKDSNVDHEHENQDLNERDYDIPVTYFHDDVARIFQHSARAKEELNHLSLAEKYCVGLARYAQDPLIEFAALGSDITAVTFDDDGQHLIPHERLLIALEQVFVNVVNKVGVDINRAASDPIYASILPYVAGLGPRKAHALVQKIVTLGGSLVNREQFIKSGILTTRLFLNAAGFLRIPQDPDVRDSSRRHGGDDYSDAPDPLDDTRVHPEDYELARKMATDALELDEEDVHGEHPSHVVDVLMKDGDNVRKLDELNLDEFAVNMYEANEDVKRHTLDVIRAELIRPFGEQRKPFTLPDPWEIATMLTGETPQSLCIGVIVTVMVLRAATDRCIVRLDSGFEGFVKPEFFSDDGYDPLKIPRNQTLQGVVLGVTLDMKKDMFQVELSTRKSDLEMDDLQFRKKRHDDHWNHTQCSRDEELADRKKRAELTNARRIIKHPNFHDFTSGQAEIFLDKQHAGDVVIRPSSKGMNHIAVTWKVADRLFQHVDVVDINSDNNLQGVGTLLVDNKYEFSDLDELIVNHVKAMARRVEELMAHEKFKNDDNELEKFLVDFVKANPTKSIYGFSLNRKRPGHFNLSFLAKRNSTIQTWPIRVAPEAYYLFDAAAAGVSELCDAFKVRHLHESQNMTAVGSKTPYGAGHMTPGRTPGYATPGRMSVRQAPRTPNPYPSGSASNGPTPSTYGGASTTYAPSAAYGATPSNGWQTPAYGNAPSYSNAPTARPPGMHPGRAEMLQQASSSSSGWAPGGGGRW